MSLARAVLDADVIFSRVLHELMGRLASGARLFDLIWSEELLEETKRSLIERKNLSAEAAEAWVEHLRREFPDGRVDISATPDDLHLAEQSGESEWSGPGAQLALAEVAIDAGEYDLALTALAHARADDQRNGHAAQIEDLLKEVRNERDDPRPQASLASLLEQLPA